MSLSAIYLIVFLMTVFGITFGFYRIGSIKNENAEKSLKSVYYVLQIVFLLGAIGKYFISYRGKEMPSSYIFGIVLFVLIPSIAFVVSLKLVKK